MRLGLIGLGRIGSFHAETLTGLGVDLVVNDALPAVTGTVASTIGATPAASPAEVLAAGIDGLVIAAATGAHPQLILAGVEAGLPVFCEKPVAKGAEEAVEVLRHCTGARVQIGYNRRFDPGFVAARAAVLSGELGRVHTVRSTTLDPAPPPAAYLADCGGIFRDCSVHDFDIVRFVTGREVREVYATGDDDTASAILTLDDDTLAVVSNSRHNGHGYDVRLEVHGSADTFAAGPGLREPPYTFFMDRFLEAYRRELTAFTEVVEGTRESPCTVADAVEAGWIAEACALSMSEHRPVTMKEVKS